ncbi:MAG: hypothetical protein QOE56_2386 [Solirubrobacterales bacterium]|jgi:ferredoxin|nr:hypothetical protein [Solirubrobacterales bacterium]
MVLRHVKPDRGLAIRCRRGAESAFHFLTPLVRPLNTAALSAMKGGGKYGKWVKRVPPLPRWLSGYRPADPWPRVGWKPPEGLAGPGKAQLDDAPDPDGLDERFAAEGIRRDRDVERAAFSVRPLHDYNLTHYEALSWLFDRLWTIFPPFLPRMARAYDRMLRVTARAPRETKRVTDAAEVTKLVRDEAARLGLSAVGFAAYDRKYQYEEYAHLTERLDGATVIVCIMEQEWEPTQTGPSGRAERAAFRAYSELLTRIGPLAEFIQDLGYTARPHDFAVEGTHIQYGVAAGLGQLGLNGQLLTPLAGSRCRLGTITTDAPLVHDKPVDYGVEKVCDSCQVCVRRCPSGAIPIKRKMHRGIVKNKIKTERCLPVVAQAHGCGVCMVTCPVQRYGLKAVQEHLSETGEVLGKGSQELEGYPWPLDGNFYGPGEKPPMNHELISPPGFYMDPGRTEPPTEKGGRQDPLDNITFG